MNGTSLLAVPSEIICADDIYGPPISRFLLLVFGGIVLFMQTGFAMLEAGFLDERGVSNILFKNMMDSLISAVAFYCCGYGFAFGGEFENTAGVALGNSAFVLSNVSPCEFPFYVFQYSFAATSVTIISGALGSRSSFSTYITYSFLIPAFVYPLVAHWVWAENGWLQKGHDGIGFKDFAGAGVVHMVGGTAGLIGCLLVGPRHERQSNPRFLRQPPHSIPLVVLGLFILYFGFLFFNGGAVLGRYQPASADQAFSAVGLAMINTLLSASAAGLVITFYNKIRYGFLSVSTTVNATIAGMVAISACAAFVQPWAALVVGLFGCLAYIGFSQLLERFRIDDAIDASSVHLAAGAVGLLISPWLYFDHGIVYSPSAEAFKQFAWNILGVVIILTWTAALSFVMFVVLKIAKALTVSDFADRYGVDRFEHEEQAYELGLMATNSRSAQPVEEALKHDVRKHPRQAVV